MSSRMLLLNSSRMHIGSSIGGTNEWSLLNLLTWKISYTDISDSGCETAVSFQQLAEMSEDNCYFILQMLDETNYLCTALAPTGEASQQFSIGTPSNTGSTRVSL